MMSYLAISDESARLWWESWKRESEEAGDRTAPPQSPEPIPRDVDGEEDYAATARVVAQRLEDLIERRGTSEIPSNDRFEAEAAVVMFDGLRLSRPVSDPEFWIWMAVATGAKLVAKRYPPTDKNRIPDRSNFTSANARETYFYRLWARGFLGYDSEASDPYALVRAGDIDFWRSHILRQSLAEARALRHALIRFQYPDGPASSPTLTTAQIRGLIKRLKRAAANINVEMLSPDQAENMIRRESRLLLETTNSAT